MKTLALLAAIGIVVATPVFAAETQADLAKVEAKATEKKADAAADADLAKAKADKKEAKEVAKADKKVAVEAAKVNPAAGTTTTEQK